MRFRDTGAGVRNPESLFRPFDKATDANGLGLYVSRAIIRSFRGELVHEPAEDGCCFAVMLNADDTRTPEPPESVSSKPKFLVVDDHELFRDAIVRLLNTEGEFTAVSECGSVDEALETITTASIDVVLLDFDLGHETGRRFIERARAMGYEGKVVILTAGVTDAEISGLIASGVAGIFMKHNSAQSLSGCIHHVLKGKGLARAGSRYRRGELAARPARPDRRKGS